MSGRGQISLEEYTREMECTVTRNGGWEPETVQSSALLRLAHAAESIPDIAESLQDIIAWSHQVNLCRTAKAVPRIARALEKGVTIRHEHALVLKLSWSIKWPWQHRAKRGQKRVRWPWGKR